MKKIAVIFGGNSYEHDISCKSAKNILLNLNKNLYNIDAIGLDKNNNWYLFSDDYELIDDNWLSKNISKIDNIVEYIKNIDLVFPIIHGNIGEDGKIQSFLDMYGISYVGCDALSSLICYDKELSKLYFEKLDIPQLPYYVLNDLTEYDKNDYEYPVIIKPAKCGSSIGINIAKNKDELKKYLKEAFKYDNKVIVEKFIIARELECAILENKDELIVSDIGEIFKVFDFYDYKSKYKNKTGTGISILNKDIEKKIKLFAKTAFKGINCKDLSRIDFLYDEEKKQVYINEINTMPGFTNISMFPILIEKMGISIMDLLNIVISNH